MLYAQCHSNDCSMEVDRSSSIIGTYLYSLPEYKVKALFPLLQDAELQSVAHAHGFAVLCEEIGAVVDAYNRYVFSYVILK